MGRMHVLCKAGDVVIEWDPKDPASTEKAEQEFKALDKAGFAFYKAGAAKKTRIKKFNKDAGKVIAAPGIAKATDKATGARPKAMSGGPVAALR